MSAMEKHDPCRNLCCVTFLNLQVSLLSMLRKKPEMKDKNTLCAPKSPQNKFTACCSKISCDLRWRARK